VTAEVYRSRTIALKVIVQTRNIEPHDPFREAKILKLLQKPCIPLLETFRDQEQRFVLAFPYMPLNLESLITRGPIPRDRIVKHFKDLLTALQYLHSQGIIHRDIKPSALLLESPDGPAFLSDFGTAWHPELSIYTEPADRKILDIGTGPYRSPEALFGDKSYGSAVDMWAVGAMLAECCRTPPKPLFESRAAHEDGNQLGLILSIFKTLGSPTHESWPEAMDFKTPPFEMYQTFEGQRWDDLLPDVEDEFRSLVASLVRYSSSARASASQVHTPVRFLVTLPRD
jgi:serine/threonine protein kinase